MLTRVRNRSYDPLVAWRVYPVNFEGWLGHKVNIPPGTCCVLVYSSGATHVHAGPGPFQLPWHKLWISRWTGRAFEVGFVNRKAEMKIHFRGLPTIDKHVFINLYLNVYLKLEANTESAGQFYVDLVSSHSKSSVQTGVQSSHRDRLLTSELCDIICEQIRRNGTLERLQAITQQLCADDVIRTLEPSFSAVSSKSRSNSSINEEWMDRPYNGLKQDDTNKLLPGKPGRLPHEIPETLNNADRNKPVPHFLARALELPIEEMLQELPGVLRGRLSIRILAVKKESTLSIAPQPEIVSPDPPPAEPLAVRMARVFPIDLMNTIIQRVGVLFGLILFTLGMVGYQPLQLVFPSKITLVSAVLITWFVLLLIRIALNKILAQENSPPTAKEKLPNNEWLEEFRYNWQPVALLFLITVGAYNLLTPAWPRPWTGLVMGSVFLGLYLIMPTAFLPTSRLRMLSVFTPLIGLVWYNSISSQILGLTAAVVIALLISSQYSNLELCGFLLVVFAPAIVSVGGWPAIPILIGFFLRDWEERGLFGSMAGILSFVTLNWGLLTASKLPLNLQITVGFLLWMITWGATAWVVGSIARRRALWSDLSALVIGLLMVLAGIYVDTLWWPEVPHPTALLWHVPLSLISVFILSIAPRYISRA